jgi:hypothetical protein
LDRISPASSEENLFSKEDAKEDSKEDAKEDVKEALF